MWPFKSPVSAAAGALFSSNAQCGTAFCLSDEKVVKLMGLHYSFRTSSLTIYYPNWILNICLGTAQLQNWLLHHPSFCMHQYMILSE
jgi:hypothetical protein